MPSLRIPDAQPAFYPRRLESVGVGRRDFLKVIGAMAAFGGLGFATEARAAKPSPPGPGEKLANQQGLGDGGGGQAFAAGARREAGQGAGAALRRRRLDGERASQS